MKEAVKTGVEIGKDVIAGKSFKESAGSNLQKVKRKVENAFDYMDENSTSFSATEDENEEISPPVFKKRKIGEKGRYKKQNYHRRTILD